MLLADIDGDGDQDVFSGSDGNGWFENIDGQGTFVEPPSRKFAADEVAMIDVDGDDDLDIVASESFGRSTELVWYENGDDSEFSTRTVISADIQRLAEFYTADTDGDGDHDLFALTTSVSKELIWIETLGRPEVSPAAILNDNPARRESEVDEAFSPLGDDLLGPDGSNGFWLA